MKRELRVSGEKDYIAVDIIDETKDGKPIQSTPLYLRKGKPEFAKAYDFEEKQWRKTKILFDGEKINCVDVDNRETDFMGLDWDIQPSDLLDETQFKFNPPTT